ncbi:ABC transporter ATP-binding protein [Dubosiella newyorkensis]|uniref:ABC transporter ATP-binding protein n=1 Tax=Dubosiella newyorkensis TaxID=1862672 RepID=UPI00248C95B4|nr:ABC transporter ATP-binding protein [Dubosiella newyorkensis]
MNKENAIEVRNMYKHFTVEYDKANTLKERLIFWKRGNKEVKEVLKDISLDIKKGETVALIGTNGSGKSTLLKLMTKIIYPNKGTLETDGKLTSLLELGAGFHPDFTGRENIYFNASIFGLTHQEIDKRIDDIIEFSELGENIDNPIRTYSSGMYMRLAFSVAINVDAEILLIDEILAVGDQHFQDKCFAKLEELKNSDKTIVIVTHSLGVVKELCDRAIWIYKGEFRLDGDPTYVIDEYLKQVAKDHHDEQKKAIESGKEKVRGIVFIDSPKDFAEIQQYDGVLNFSGWQLANSEDALLKIVLDEEVVDSTEIRRTTRQDVYNAYLEQFAGFIEESKLGWSFDRLCQDFEKGTHHLKVSCIMPNGETLTEKEIAFQIV